MKKRILILSGPTHEYIDPVRFIGNASSGLMGKAIAEAAVDYGYLVDFVTGPICTSNLPALGKNGSIHPIVSATQMLETATALFDSANAIVFAAAVADYAPTAYCDQKMESGNNELTISLVPNPDIAKTLCAHKRDDQIAIGFALQTGNGEIHARRKLASKNLDGIILNSPASLGASDGTFSYISKVSERFESWGTLDKPTCAKRIIDHIAVAS